MKRILLFIIVLLQIYSCDKDKYQFPDAYVNTYLYPNNVEFNGLNFPGGSTYINGGVNGILIFHDLFDNYIAYDRACTNEPLNSCEQIYINDDELNMLSCHCCDSEYFIFDGGVTQGPANYGLHRYKTSFDGVRLRVYN
jgi:Rieske Fe-S protein|tara:strand:- start:135 stop:551 length:417 start_codon:yes stop_codon:yes gene_type:complete